MTIKISVSLGDAKAGGASPLPFSPPPSPSETPETRIIPFSKMDKAAEKWNPAPKNPSVDSELPNSIDWSRFEAAGQKYIEIIRAKIHQELKARGLQQGTPEFKDALKKELKKPEYERLRTTHKILDDKKPLSERAHLYFLFIAKEKKALGLQKALEGNSKGAHAEFQASARAFEKAFRLSGQVEEAKEAADTFFSAGSLAKKTGEEGQAKIFFQQGVKALENALAAGELKDKGQGLKLLGKGFLELEDYSRALKNLEQAQKEGDHSSDLSDLILFARKQEISHARLGKEFFERLEALGKKRQEGKLSPQEANELTAKQRGLELLKLSNSLTLPGTPDQPEQPLLSTIREKIFEGLQGNGNWGKLKTAEADLRRFGKAAAEIWKIHQIREKLLEKYPPYVQDYVHRTGDWSWMRLDYGGLKSTDEWNPKALNEIPFLKAYHDLQKEDFTAAKQVEEAFSILQNPELLADKATRLEDLETQIERLKKAVYEQAYQSESGILAAHLEQFNGPSKDQPVEGLVKLFKSTFQREAEESPASFVKFGLEENADKLKEYSSLLKDLSSKSQNLKKAQGELDQAKATNETGKIEEAEKKVATAKKELWELSGKVREFLSKDSKTQRERLKTLQSQLIKGEIQDKFGKPYETAMIKADQEAGLRALSLPKSLPEFEKCSEGDLENSTQKLLKDLQGAAGVRALMQRTFLFVNAHLAGGIEGDGKAGRWEKEARPVIWGLEQKRLNQALGLSELTEANLKNQETLSEIREKNGGALLELNAQGIDKFLKSSDVYQRKTDRRAFQDLPTNLKEGIDGQIEHWQTVRKAMVDKEENVAEVDKLIGQYYQAKSALEGGDLKKSLALFKMAADSRRQIKAAEDFEWMQTKEGMKTLALEVAIVTAATLLTAGAMSGAAALSTTVAAGAEAMALGEATFGAQLGMFALESAFFIGIDKGLRYGTHQLGKKIHIHLVDDPLAAVRDEKGTINYKLLAADYTYEVIKNIGLFKVLRTSSAVYRGATVGQKVLGEAGSKTLLEEAYKISASHGEMVYQQLCEKAIQGMGKGERALFKAGDFLFEAGAMHGWTNITTIPDHVYHSVVHEKGSKNLSTHLDLLITKMENANSPESILHGVAQLAGLKLGGFGTHGLHQKLANKKVQAHVAEKNLKKFDELRVEVSKKFTDPEFKMDEPAYRKLTKLIELGDDLHEPFKKAEKSSPTDKDETSPFTAWEKVRTGLEMTRKVYEKAQGKGKGPVTTVEEDQTAVAVKGPVEEASAEVKTKGLNLAAAAGVAAVVTLPSKKAQAKPAHAETPKSEPLHAEVGHVVSRSPSETGTQFMIDGGFLAAGVAVAVAARKTGEIFGRYHRGIGPIEAPKTEQHHSFMPGAGVIAATFAGIAWVMKTHPNIRTSVLDAADRMEAGVKNLVQKGWGEVKTWVENFQRKNHRKEVNKLLKPFDSLHLHGEIRDRLLALPLSEVESRVEKACNVIEGDPALKKSVAEILLNQSEEEWKRALEFTGHWAHEMGDVSDVDARRNLLAEWTQIMEERNRLESDQKANPAEIFKKQKEIALRIQNLQEKLEEAKDLADDSFLPESAAEIQEPADLARAALSRDGYVAPKVQPTESSPAKPRSLEEQFHDIFSAPLPEGEAWTPKNEENKNLIADLNSRRETKKTDAHSIAFAPENKRPSVADDFRYAESGDIPPAAPSPSDLRAALSGEGFVPPKTAAETANLTEHEIDVLLADTFPTPEAPPETLGTGEPTPSPSKTPTRRVHVEIPTYRYDGSIPSEAKPSLPPTEKVKTTVPASVDQTLDEKIIDLNTTHETARSAATPVDSKAPAPLTRYEYTLRQARLLARLLKEHGFEGSLTSYSVTGSLRMIVEANLRSGELWKGKSEEGKNDSIRGKVRDLAGGLTKQFGLEGKKDFEPALLKQSLKMIVEAHYREGEKGFGMPVKTVGAVSAAAKAPRKSMALKPPPRRTPLNPKNQAALEALSRRENFFPAAQSEIPGYTFDHKTTLRTDPFATLHDDPAATLHDDPFATLHDHPEMTLRMERPPTHIDERGAAPLSTLMGLSAIGLGILTFFQTRAGVAFKGVGHTLSTVIEQGAQGAIDFVRSFGETLPSGSLGASLGEAFAHGNGTVGLIAGMTSLAAAVGMAFSSGGNRGSRRALHEGIHIDGHVPLMVPWRELGLLSFGKPDSQGVRTCLLGRELIPDQTVSREHAELHWQNGQLFLVNSTPKPGEKTFFRNDKQTYVKKNDKWMRLEPRGEYIKSGDEFAFGGDSTMENSRREPPEGAVVLKIGNDWKLSALEDPTQRTDLPPPAPPVKTAGSEPQVAALSDEPGWTPQKKSPIAPASNPEELFDRVLNGDDLRGLKKLIQEPVDEHIFNSLLRPMTKISAGAFTFYFSGLVKAPEGTHGPERFYALAMVPVQMSAHVATIKKILFYKSPTDTRWSVSTKETNHPEIFLHLDLLSLEGQKKDSPFTPLTMDHEEFRKYIY